MTHAPTTGTASRSPRWYVFKRAQVHIGDEMFTDRVWLLMTPWAGVMITRIFSPDTGRDPHDHARSFISVALSGGYTEEIWDTRDMSSGAVLREHHAWWPYVLRRHQAHNITRVIGPLRTVVVTGPHRGPWRFWTPAGPVNYPDYG